MTASGLLKHLPEFLRRRDFQLLTAFQALIMPLRSLFQNFDLFGRRAIIALRIIGRFDVDLAQRDGMPSTNANCIELQQQQTFDQSRQKEPALPSAQTQL